MGAPNEIYSTHTLFKVSEVSGTTTISGHYSIPSSCFKTCSPTKILSMQKYGRKYHEKLESLGNILRHLRFVCIFQIPLSAPNCNYYIESVVGCWLYIYYDMVELWCFDFDFYACGWLPKFKLPFSATIHAVNFSSSVLFVSSQGNVAAFSLSVFWTLKLIDFGNYFR